MKMNGELKSSQKLISLDQVIHMIFDEAETSQNPSVFGFMKVHDRKIMAEIRQYTQAVKNADFNDTDDPKLDDIVENLSSDLTDAVLTSDFAYFENGMKFGSRLLLELIE